jgi:thioredoxin reductase
MASASAGPSTAPSQCGAAGELGGLAGLEHEVVVLVGGAAAGLAAALVLGRARVRTLVVHAGEPSNRSAPAIGGLLGQDGTSPDQLYAAGREQLTELPAVELREGVVTGIEPAATFRATLAGGETIAAARILIAGGMRYGLPDVPGLSELWGDSAFMCPYCHGWEHRDQRIAILGGAGAAHRVALLRSWTSDLVVLADGEPTDELGDIPVDERPVASVAPGVIRFADGGALEIDALHVVAPMSPRDGLVAGLGLETTDSQQGTGIAVADRFGATSAPGVFAAGDAAGAGNVAAAIATGSLAATGLHRSLVLPEDA